jgi:hypothetical protein
VLVRDIVVVFEVRARDGGHLSPASGTRAAVVPGDQLQPLEFFESPQDRSRARAVTASAIRSIRLASQFLAALGGDGQGARKTESRP